MQEILQKFTGIPEPKDFGSIPGAGILKNIFQICETFKCGPSAKIRRDISSFGVNIVFRSKYVFKNISRTMCLENAICLVTQSPSKTPEQLYESKAYLLNPLKSSIRVPPFGLIYVQKHFNNNVFRKRKLPRNPNASQKNSTSIVMCFVNAICLVTQSPSKTPEQLYEAKAYLLNPLKSSIRVPPFGLNLFFANTSRTMCFVNAICLVTQSPSKTPEQLYESKAYLLNPLKSSIRVPSFGLNLFS